MPRNAHKGYTAAIRALLQTSEPLRADQIAERLSIPLDRVRDALNFMVTRIGGATYCGYDGKLRLYTAPGKVKRRLRPAGKGGSGVICPPPYVTGYRWRLR